MSPVTIWGTLEQLVRPFTAKTWGKVFVVLYALGLLVTNEALIAIHVTDFSLPKYQGIFTGIWCLALVLVGAIPVDACYLLLIKPRPAYERLLMLPFALGGTFYLTVCASWVILLLCGIGVGSDQHLAGVPAVALPGTGLRVPAVCAWIPLLFAGAASIVSIASRDFIPTRGRLLVIFGIALLMSTWIIATSVYAYIPKQLGGGWPDRVRITLTSDGVDVWASLCGPFKDKGTNMTGTVALNYAGKEDYVLTVRVGAVANRDVDTTSVIVQLNKKFVAALTARPDNEDESCAPPFEQ